MQRRDLLVFLILAAFFAKSETLNGIQTVKFCENQKYFLKCENRELIEYEKEGDLEKEEIICRHSIRKAVQVCNDRKRKLRICSPKNNTDASNQKWGFFLKKSYSKCYFLFLRIRYFFDQNDTKVYFGKPPKCLRKNLTPLIRFVKFDQKRFHIFTDNVTKLDHRDICFSDKLDSIFGCEDDQDSLMSIMGSILRFLSFSSAIFLLASITISIFVREGNRNFRLCSIFMQINLFFFFLIFATLLNSPIRGLMCEIMGFGLQFFYISALLWLNCMTWHIWNCFRRLKMSSRENEFDFWTKSAFFAVGIPSIIVVLTLSIHFSNAKFFVKPEMGLNRCFFGSVKATILYFYSIVAPSLFLNILGFLSTIWNLYYGVWKPDQILNKVNIIFH